MPRTKPVRLFLSYSSKDQRYKTDLETNLAVLKNSRQIKSWDMGEITPGADWDDSVRKALADAQVILLIVTADFLASKYINQVELKNALKRHRERTVIVIPIIVTYSAWEDTALKTIQALPPKGKPIVSWKPRSKGWLEVAQGVRKAVTKISGDAKTLEAESPTAGETARAKRVAANRKPKAAGRKPGDALRALAREYEHRRAGMESSGARTAVMERIYAEMLGAAAATTLAEDDVLKELAASKSPGERLAAVAILEKRPNKRYLKWLGQRFKVETPFVGYHAATALHAAAGVLGRKEARHVQAAIDEGLRALGPERASTDRAGMLLHTQEKLASFKRRS